jgi:hypothetical protein
VCQTTRKGIGAACSYDRTAQFREETGCDHDLFCKDMAAGRGHCAPMISLGEACGAHDKCLGDALCEHGMCVIATAAERGQSCGARQCAPGLYCSDAHTCETASLVIGASCGLVDGSFVDNACALGTTCGSLEFPNGGGGRGTVSTCMWLPKAGEPCQHEVCDAGLFCHNESSDSTGIVPKLCRPLHAAGETCSRVPYFEVDCAQGLDCRDGRCSAPC